MHCVVLLPRVLSFLITFTREIFEPPAITGYNPAFFECVAFLLKQCTHGSGLRLSMPSTAGEALCTILLACIIPARMKEVI